MDALSRLHVTQMPLPHGGNPAAAAHRYGIPLHDWLDLSTGINPHAWPVPTIPAAIYQRLPQPQDGLEEAACRYYDTTQLLPAAGSQAAIQALPLLRPPSRVVVISPCYAEHAHAWRRWHHTVMEWTTEAFEQALAADQAIDVVVIANPNNPTGLQVPIQKLLGWHKKLQSYGGWLIVDEAFMDATPQNSLAPFSGCPGLVVLRSLGKFFGLAGVRVGFVLAEPTLLERLNTLLGPWSVNGPGRWVATQALQDITWQQAMRVQLQTQQQRLAILLRKHNIAISGATALFQWICHPQAAAIHEQLAQRGIWTRLFPSAEPFYPYPGVRFGLPGTEAEWQRLDQAL